jgi:septum formation protein
MIPSLILASSSTYRAELLQRLGIPFIQDRPDVDESALNNETPRETALRLAETKARHVADRHPGSVIIGSDQLASLNGEALGKPGTLQNAQTQLGRLSGQVVTFHTAICVLDTRSGQRHLHEVPCEVLYRELTAHQIESYLTQEPAFDCAGAARIEALGISLTRYVRCDDPTALIGLPLITVVDLLKQCGIAIP